LAHPIPVYQAVILGIVQGITEFLPISSTGHLVLIPRLLHWQDMGLTFDAALHTGTLLALLSYFWRDWVGIVRSAAAPFRGKQEANPALGRNLLWGIVIACIPAGVAGPLVSGTLDKILQTRTLDLKLMAVVASALAIVGMILYAADKYGSKRKRELAQTNLLDWVTIGIAQAAALIPGVSRSGATISAGLFCGLARDTAARFSFLLSTPILLGVAGLGLRKIIKHGLPPGEAAPFAAGVASSMIVGYLAIKFLLAYLRRRSVNVFVWYRLGLAAVITAVVALRV